MLNTLLKFNPFTTPARYVTSILKMAKLRLRNLNNLLRSNRLNMLEWGFKPGTILPQISSSI